jgi:two-component system OmpR family response regulator
MRTGRHTREMFTADTTMNPQPHLLVVDDHHDIRDSLSAYFHKYGYRVSTASNAATARKVLATWAIDLVVLDIMMPGEDGLALCRFLREATGVPIILLTAMTEDTDRVVGLEMGADDYVTKPFNPRELLARIKAVLRRTHALPPQRQVWAPDTLRFDCWTLDVRRRELTDADGVAVPLSTAEFVLLNVFLHHPQLVLSRDQLLDLTSGRDADVFDRSIDNRISRLRKKIEADPKRPRLIKTHWGGGYSFTAEVLR